MALKFKHFLIGEFSFTFIVNFMSMMTSKLRIRRGRNAEETSRGNEQMPATSVYVFACVCKCFSYIYSHAHT